MSSKQRDTTFGERLLGYWARLRHRPGGKWLFSRIIGRLAPYTGTMKALVLELEPGRAVVELRDRRRVRNHLRSVHAIALANLGELASGLATTAAMPRGVRGIPVAIAVEYKRKARGTLLATGTAAIPDFSESATTDAHADIRDAAGDTVASVRVRWQLERL